MLGLAAVLFTSGCIVEPGGYAGPQNPGYQPGYQTGYQPGYNRPGYNPNYNPNYNGGHTAGANNAATYREAGLKHGSSDRARGLSHDPARYFGTVPPQFQRPFASGYSNGYGQMSNAVDNKYYQGGSVTGADDFQKGRSYDPSRYASTVPEAVRADFSRGYANGWRSAGGR